MLHGFVATGFEPVREAFAKNFAENDELGAGFALVQHGEVKVNLWGGYADRAQTKPWAQDTLVPVYSTTKPIAALVIAWLHDQGRLDLEAPIKSIWPAFAAHGKGEISIAAALGHQAGVPGFLNPIDPELWFDRDGMEAALAALPPLWLPGTAHGYHPVTFGVIAGAIARRADGRTLGAILRDEMCSPAGIDFFIGVPADQHTRCAEIARPKIVPSFASRGDTVKAAFGTPWAAPARGGAAWREAEFPGVNGHGTALSTAQLYQAFATGGVLLGRRLFGEEAYAALTKPRGEDEQDLVLPFSLSFAAGVVRNTNHFYGPNPNTLGHSGWGGSCGFADPALGISAAYVMNRQSQHLMADPRALRLVEATYQCV